MTEQEQDQEILRLRQDLRDLSEALACQRALVDSVLTVLKLNGALRIHELRHAPEARALQEQLQKGELK